MVNGAVFSEGPPGTNALHVCPVTVRNMYRSMVRRNIDGTKPNV